MEQLWAWTAQPRPHWRDSKWEAAVCFAVFGATGSTSMKVVRPLLSAGFGIEATLRGGPWSYRLMAVLGSMPAYALLLLCFGTLAGRYRYFSLMAGKILARFLPKALGTRLRAALLLAAAAAGGSAGGERVAA